MCTKQKNSPLGLYSAWRHLKERGEYVSCLVIIIATFCKGHSWSHNAFLTISRFFRDTCNFVLQWTRKTGFFTTPRLRDRHVYAHQLQFIYSSFKERTKGTKQTIYTVDRVYFAFNQYASRSKRKLTRGDWTSGEHGWFVGDFWVAHGGFQWKGSHARRCRFYLHVEPFAVRLLSPIADGSFSPLSASKANVAQVQTSRHWISFTSIQLWRVYRHVRLGWLWFRLHIFCGIVCIHHLLLFGRSMVALSFRPDYGAVSQNRRASSHSQTNRNNGQQQVGSNTAYTLPDPTGRNYSAEIATHQTRPISPNTTAHGHRFRRGLEQREQQHGTGPNFLGVVQWSSASQRRVSTCLFLKIMEICFVANSDAIKRL